jgi:hypothetical protein
MKEGWMMSEKLVSAAGTISSREGSDSGGKFVIPYRNFGEMNLNMVEAVCGPPWNLIVR